MSEDTAIESRPLPDLSDADNLREAIEVLVACVQGKVVLQHESRASHMSLVLGTISVTGSSKPPDRRRCVNGPSQRSGAGMLNRQSGSGPQACGCGSASATSTNAS